MTFIDTPLKKIADEDMNPARIMKILKLLENQDLAQINLSDSLKNLRLSVVEKIRKQVLIMTYGDLSSANPSKVLLKHTTPKEYLDKLPQLLIYFQNVDGRLFNLDYMLNMVDYDNLLPRDRRPTQLYVDIKNELTEMFRIMQVVKQLRGFTVKETKQLYEALLATYNQN